MHKSEDYKISVFKYYSKNKDNIRRNREPMFYKITKPQVKTVLELLKQK